MAVAAHLDVGQRQVLAVRRTRQENLQFDFRTGLGEGRQARNQDLPGEGRRRAQGQPLLALDLATMQRNRRELGEDRRDLFEVLAAVGGQRQRAAVALQQAHPEHPLETGNPLAGGAAGDRQEFGGALEGTQPGSRFERLQRFDGRKTEIVGIEHGADFTRCPRSGIPRQSRCSLAAARRSGAAEPAAPPQEALPGL